MKTFQAAKQQTDFDAILGQMVWWAITLAFFAFWVWLLVGAATPAWLWLAGWLS